VLPLREKLFKNVFRKSKFSLRMYMYVSDPMAAEVFGNRGDDGPSPSMAASTMVVWTMWQSNLQMVMALDFMLWINCEASEIGGGMRCPLHLHLGFDPPQ
jgi:hypothetical protein